MKITNTIHLLKHEAPEIVASSESVQPNVYSYIIFGKKSIALLDSGYAGSYKKIFEYIENRGRSISEIKWLILSHAHPHHIGSARYIKQITNCEVIAHKAEREWIEDIDKQYLESPVRGFYSLVNKSVKIDRFVEDKDKLVLEPNLELQFFHTPGHSPGSISVMVHPDKALFIGDAIPLLGAQPDYQDYKQLTTTLDRIESLENNVDVLLSSWIEPHKEEHILELTHKGKMYLQYIDQSVKKHYTKGEFNLNKCEAVIKEQKLPSNYVNRVADMAFQSHFS